MLRGLAGIAEADRISPYGVNESAAILRRFEYVERRLTRLMAGALVEQPLWEVKQALARHAWEDAEHTAWLRKRIVEMRLGPRSFERFDEPALRILLDEAIHAAGDPAELLAGVYLAIKRALIAAYRHHLAATQPLVDFPTVRALRLILLEEEAQLAWAEEAWAELAADPAARARAEAWAGYLGGLIAAAGGIDGQQPIPPGTPAPGRRRSHRPYRIPRTPGRDPRFATNNEDNYSIADGERPSGDPAADRERVRVMLSGRINEMAAVETVAAVIYEAEGQEWSFYHDLARHMWDECRHCCLGEVGLRAELGIGPTEVPQRLAFTRKCLAMTPAENYALLGIVAEHGMMQRRYKQAEYHFARDAGFRLAAQFQDYDWADEALHVAIARRWLPELARQEGRPLDDIVQASRHKYFGPAAAEAVTTG